MAVIVKKGKDKRPLRVCIYGSDGSGKSTWARHGLFLDFEGGLGEIDWGILAVYTCANSCVDSMNSYTREYVFRQPID